MGDAMPALPWPYVVALCVSLGGAIAALYKRDINREARREVRDQEAVDKLAGRIADNTAALRDVAEVLK